MAQVAEIGESVLCMPQIILGFFSILCWMFSWWFMTICGQSSLVLIKTTIKIEDSTGCPFWLEMLEKLESHRFSALAGKAGIVFLGPLIIGGIIR